MCDIYVYTHVGVYGCVHAHVCVFISIVIAMKKYHNLKQFGGEKGLYGLHFHIVVHYRRKSEQEFK